MRGLERALGKFCMEYLKFIVQICIYSNPNFTIPNAHSACLQSAYRSPKYQSNSNQIQSIPTSEKSVGRDHIWPHALEESNTSCGSMNVPHKSTVFCCASGDDSTSKLLLLRLLGYLRRDVLVSMVVFAACHDLTIPWAIMSRSFPQSFTLLWPMCF